MTSDSGFGERARPGCRSLPDRQDSDAGSRLIDGDERAACKEFTLRLKHRDDSGAKVCRGDVLGADLQDAGPAGTGQRQRDAEVEIMVKTTVW